MRPGNAARRDAGLPAVRDHLNARHFRHLSNAANFGEPARPRDVGLNHRHPAALDPIADFMPAGPGLRTADADRAHGREAGVAREIIVMQRGFGEIDVAVGCVLKNPERIVPALP
jgi:hypothetical protein